MLFYSEHVIVGQVSFWCCYCYRYSSGCPGHAPLLFDPKEDVVTPRCCSMLVLVETPIRLWQKKHVGTECRANIRRSEHSDYTFLTGRLGRNFKHHSDFSRGRLKVRMRSAPHSVQSHGCKCSTPRPQTYGKFYGGNWLATAVVGRGKAAPRIIMPKRKPNAY